MASLGIVTAMKQEAFCLVKDRDQNRRQIVPAKPARLWNGTLLVISGIGAERARLAAEKLIKKGVTSLISWGTAGALVPNLSAGSLVVPQKVLLPGCGLFLADEEWHNRLETRLKMDVDFQSGPILQSDRVLRNPQGKMALAKKCGGIAVDMESAAVAEAALSANIPFVAIRAISDSVNMNIPLGALTAFDELGKLRLVRMLKTLGRRPHDLFRLIQLARGFQAALRTLKTVLTLTNYRLLAP